MKWLPAVALLVCVEATAFAAPPLVDVVDQIDQGDSLLVTVTFFDEMHNLVLPAQAAYQVNDFVTGKVLVSPIYFVPTANPMDLWLSTDATKIVNKTQNSQSPPGTELHAFSLWSTWLSANGWRDGTHETRFPVYRRPFVPPTPTPGPTPTPTP